MLRPPRRGSTPPGAGSKRSPVVLVLRWDITPLSFMHADVTVPKNEIPRLRLSGAKVEEYMAEVSKFPHVKDPSMVAARFEFTGGEAKVKLPTDPETEVTARVGYVVVFERVVSRRGSTLKNLSARPLERFLETDDGSPNFPPAGLEDLAAGKRHKDGYLNPSEVVKGWLYDAFNPVSALA